MIIAKRPRRYAQVIRFANTVTEGRITPIAPPQARSVAKMHPLVECRKVCEQRRGEGVGDLLLGARCPLKNSGSHIDASLSRQPLVKGERLVRLEVNAVMPDAGSQGAPGRGS